MAGTDKYAFEIAGSLQRQRTLEAIVGADADKGARNARIARLVREPSHIQDVNAVRVEIAGQLVGYLRREDVAEYDERMGELDLAGRAAECKAKIIRSRNGATLAVMLDLTWPLKIEKR
ncbi:MAG: hypothetical protein HY269_09805 [Deltaproteobacteria bacterium]|nr:hypothetical protein [Deltaproteobacteria bacterium]